MVRCRMFYQWEFSGRTHPEMHFGSFSDPWSNQAMPRLLGHPGRTLECLASRRFVGGANVHLTVCQSGSPQG